MKLAIGSAQFGLSYGISNSAGKVSNGTIRDILDYCRHNSIDLIDTAMSYGDAESRLGDCGVSPFDIITKLPRVPESVSDVRKWVRESFFSSLKNLKVTKVYGVLMHSPGQLLEPNGSNIYRALCELRDIGLVSKIGISTYDPFECRKLAKIFQFSIIQAPLNIIDRRFYESGCIEEMAANDIEVHVRSIYLQGLLLMSEKAIPSQFKEWKEFFSSWIKWVEDSGFKQPQACLAFVNQIPGVNRVVIGVESVEQISEVNLSYPKISLGDFPVILKSSDRLINPSLWKK